MTPSYTVQFPSFNRSEPRAWMSDLASLWCEAATAPYVILVTEEKNR